MWQSAWPLKQLVFSIAAQKTLESNEVGIAAMDIVTPSGEDASSSPKPM
jgi:hypothetical protein